MPLPFSRIVFAFAEPLRVPPDARDEDLDVLRRELTRRLRAARTRAQAGCG